MLRLAQGRRTWSIFFFFQPQHRRTFVFLKGKHISKIETRLRASPLRKLDRILTENTFRRWNEISHFHRSKGKMRRNVQSVSCNISWRCCCIQSLFDFLLFQYKKNVVSLEKKNNRSAGFPPIPARCGVIALSHRTLGFLGAFFVSPKEIIFFEKSCSRRPVYLSTIFCWKKNNLELSSGCPNLE